MFDDLIHVINVRGDRRMHVMECRKGSTWQGKISVMYINIYNYQLISSYKIYIAPPPPVLLQINKCRSMPVILFGCFHITI